MGNKCSYESYVEDSELLDDGNLGLSDEFEELEDSEGSECIYGEAQRVEGDQTELYIVDDSRLILQVDKDADYPTSRDSQLFDYTKSISSGNWDDNRFRSWISRVYESDMPGSGFSDYASAD